MKSHQKEILEKRNQQFMEVMGITQEGQIVSVLDLEEREEVLICQEHMRSLWNKEESW